MLGLLFSFQVSCEANQFYRPSTSSCVECPPKSAPTADLSACACEDQSASFDVTSATCVCPENSFNLAGSCIGCDTIGVNPDKTGCNCEFGFDIFQRRCCTSNEVFAENNCWTCPAGAVKEGNTCNCNKEGVVYNAVTNVCECPDSEGGAKQYYDNALCKACPTTAESGATGKLSAIKDKCTCVIETQIFDKALQKCACGAHQYFYGGKVCRSCPQGSSFTGTEGTPCTCNIPNTAFVLDSNECRCNAPFFYVEDTCKECPSDSTVSEDNKRCTCNGKDAYFDPLDITCKCQKIAFKNNAHDCITCPANAKPDAAQTTCTCPANHVYATDSNTCVCDANSIPKDAGCMRCPEDATKSSDGTKCVCNDAINGVYVEETNKCICKDNTMYKQAGICVPCPQDALPSPELTECLCLDPQKHFSNDLCEACPTHSVWDAATEECKCIPPATFLNDACACPAEQGWLFGQCTTCPENSAIVDGTCTCGEGLVLSRHGCVTAGTDIAQRSTEVNMKTIRLPGSHTKPNVCYYREFLGAYAYLDRDLDFNLCPSDASVSLFLEPRRLQNNLIQGTLFFADQTDFLGAFAMYQSTVEITDMRFTVSIFAPSLINASLLCGTAQVLKLYDSNFTYIYGNQTTNTFYGLVRTVQQLSINLLDYEAELYNDRQGHVYLISGPVNASTLLNDTRFNINISCGRQFAAIQALDGDAVVSNVNYTGSVKSQTGGLVFYDAGAGKSGNVKIQSCQFNASMWQNTVYGGSTHGTIGYRTYLSNLLVSDSLINGQRQSNSQQCALFYNRQQNSNTIRFDNSKLCMNTYNGSVKQYQYGSNIGQTDCQ